MTQDDILFRFPGPVVLYPSRRKLLVLAFIAALFVAGGLLMIAKNDKYGWGAVLFFGLGLIVFCVQMLPNAAYLKLDRDGFQIAHMFRRQAWRWQNVGDFMRFNPLEDFPMSTSANGLIFFTDKAAGAPAPKKLNALITSGRNAMLPDRYGLPADELVSVMEKWRERASADANSSRAG